MKIISILIIPIFILSSCNINQENIEINQKQIIFENNIKCNNSIKRFTNTKNMKYSIEMNSCIALYGKEYSENWYFIKNTFTSETLFFCENKNDTEFIKCKDSAYSKFKNIK